MLRTLSLSALLAIGLSLFLDLSLQVNDSVSGRSGEPWITGAILAIQRPGIEAISRVFPCEKETGDTGCEEYKIAPLFLAVNALVYLPFVFLAVYLTRMSELTPRQATVIRRIGLILGIVASATGVLLSFFVGLAIDTTPGLPSHDWAELIVSIPLFSFGILLVVFS